jgi:hypothetical protein|tara:strand:+ start:759 stop:1442 length:684 start_codon:yes stop_codon:yes gene_type:complete
MRYFLIAIGFTGVILSAQQANFRFDNMDGKDARNIVFYTSYWLSNHPQLNPDDGNRRLWISIGYSSYFRKIHGDRWILPDFDIVIRITRNLSLTGKLYGFQLEKDAPQVIGSGFQYYFGKDDSKTWVSSLQRVDLKGIAHFRLTSITINIHKWFSGPIVDYSIGAGANIYKGKSYYKSIETLEAIEGQTNFFGLDAIMPFNTFRLGLGIKIHPEFQLFRIYIVKNFF